MSKRDPGPQFDFGERKGRKADDAPKVRPTVVPFVDAITMQVRRDAMRRVASTGIFASKHGKD